MSLHPHRRSDLSCGPKCKATKRLFIKLLGLLGHILPIKPTLTPNRARSINKNPTWSQSGRRAHMSGREAQPVTTGGPITGCRARIPRQPTFEKGHGRLESSAGPRGPYGVVHKTRGLSMRARGGKSNTGGPPCRTLRCSGKDWRPPAGTPPDQNVHVRRGCGVAGSLPRALMPSTSNEHA